jgi:glycosyltransferase involved in cell wall biosynthesis
VFIGHLVEIKGIEMLVDAWRGIPYHLRVIGTGPLRGKLSAMAPKGVEFLGALPLSEIMGVLAASAFVVFPSVCRETFGRVMIEAFAMGRAVIASRHGTMQELVRHNDTGLLYEPGNIEDLRTQVQYLVNNTELRTRLGQAARSEYLDKFTAEVNYPQLMGVYELALARRHSARCDQGPLLDPFQPA